MAEQPFFGGRGGWQSSLKQKNWLLWGLMLTTHKFNRNYGMGYIDFLCQNSYVHEFQAQFFMWVGDTGSLNPFSYTRFSSYYSSLTCLLLTICFSLYMFFPLHYHDGYRLDVKDERHHLGTWEGNHLHNGQGHVQVSMRSQLF